MAGKWSHRIVEFEGRHVSVSIDDSYRDAPAERLALAPRLARFGVYCTLDAGAAFWHPDETDTLNSIEGELLRLCGSEAQGWVTHVACIHTWGVREYYLHFGGQAELRPVMPELRAAFPDYRIDFDERLDPAWEFYKEWLKRADR